MAAILAAKEPFTPEILADLRMRCLSAARAARSMEQVGTGMGARDLIHDPDRVAKTQQLVDRIRAR